MKIIQRFVFGFLLMATLASCSHDDNPFENIWVTWEVVSNTYSDNPVSKSIITIKNLGGKNLEGNWVLYFNQTPRSIINAGDKNFGWVEHISGDWYRVIPGKEMIIKPNDQVEIVYESEYWFIKESDAPTGIYIVWNDHKGFERIFEVKNFSIKPFSRPEQVMRHLNDLQPLPSPDNDYLANQGIYVIPNENLLNVIPSPKSIATQKGSMALANNLTIYYQNGNLDFEANYLKNQIENLFRWNVLLETGQEPLNNFIELAMIENKTIPRKGYRLTTDAEKRVRIEASEKSGVFYGIQSLISLLPIESIIETKDTIVLPIIGIEDSPRFGYRGVHIDVVRNFFPKETILKIIDILAYYKINTLHLHLTDDEGWRIEIKSLPELTKVGGQRHHTSKEENALHPGYGSGPFVNSTRGSGYFTQADFIEILNYAKQRHIRVIPEINMPGHCRAAIKAMEARYAFYKIKGDEVAANEFRLIDPNDWSEYLSAQFYNDNVANVALESTYRFFEVVVDEIIEMYRIADAPLEIIHVGGDEVPKGAWSKSMLVDNLMAKRPDIKHYENMHAYFTERALEILGKKGLKMAGWEEVALIQGERLEVNPIFANGNVIPYVWNSLWGSQDLAYRLANRGYPVVLSHVTNFYLDLAYSNHPKEPGLYWGGFVNTFKAWHYNPYNVFKTLTKDNMGKPVDIEMEYKYMERLKPEARKNILGLQAQLWSETIKNAEMLEYYLLPKLIGFSETAWAKERRWETENNYVAREKQVKEDWNLFANTLAQKELPKLKYLFGGFNYRLPPPGAIIENGLLKANVEYPGLSIRYTLNGEEPTILSPIYKSPIEVKNKTDIKLKSFDATGTMSRTVEFKLNSDESIF